MSRLINLFLCFAVTLSLGGCRWIEAMFVPPIYQPERLWFKRGVNKDETKKIYNNCCSECSMLFYLTIDPRIEAEKCMLAKGFKFIDHGWLLNYGPHSVCSERFAEFNGLKSYMDLPSCQSLRGLYKP